MSDFAEPESGEPLKSKYNNAVDQIMRFGEIWRNAYKHSSSGDFVSWNQDLDAVWRELAGDLNPEKKDDKTIEENFNKINEALVKLQPLRTRQAPGFNTVERTTLDTISKQYLKIQEKEIFLRRLQNKLGKGTAYDEREDDDFG